MPTHKSPVEDAPSLAWVLPLACAVWTGLFVDGWFARPSERNLLFMVTDPVFDVMVMPAFTLLGVWCLMTPAKVTLRLQALLFVLFTSLPIAYLAHQRPGQSFSGVQGPLQYYLDRYYSLGTIGLPILDFTVAVSIAAFCVLGLNRALTQIRFQRVPVESVASTKSLRQRRSEAFRTSLVSESEKAVQQRREDRILLGLAISLVAICLGYWRLSTTPALDTTFRMGLLYGIFVYLFVWLAGECVRPRRSCLILWIGLAGMAAFPHWQRLSAASARISTVDGWLVCLGSISLAIVLLTCSLVLLLSSHQLPRRTKALPLGFAFAENHVPFARQASSQVRFWLTSAVLWAIGCSLAFWVPLNLDPENLTDEETLSVRDAWLAAQFLQANGGDRTRFRIARDEITNHTTVYLRVPEVNAEWSRCLSLLEQRSAEGDPCWLEIDAPIPDLPWIERTLRQGIHVTCSLDAGGKEVPLMLIGMPGLNVRNVHNAAITEPVWAALKNLNHQPLFREIVDSRLPDVAPPQLGNVVRDGNVLRRCVASENLLADITRMSYWPRSTVTLIDPQLPRPMDGLTLAKFLYHEELLGVPPIELPQISGFAPLFVPVYADDRYSRLELSARPLLLTAELGSAVQAAPINVPRLVGFDNEGRLTELGVTPTRDCPATIPWTTLPDVQHMYVNLVASAYDSRGDANERFEPEDIGFQSAAFPKLSRVTIYSQQLSISTVSLNQQPRSMYEVWDPRFDKFLRELLQHPGLMELNVECNFTANLWQVLVEAGSVERLVVRSGHVRDLPWLEWLPRFTKLQEVVVMAEMIGPVQQNQMNSPVHLSWLQQYLADLGGPSPVHALPDGIEEEATVLEKTALADGLPKGGQQGAGVEQTDAELVDAEEENVDGLEGAALDQAIAEAESRLQAEWKVRIEAAFPGVEVRIVPVPPSHGNLRWP